MQNYPSRLYSLVERNTDRLLALPEAVTSTRPASGRWSPREVLGHLVDSASNNHQRFVQASLGEPLRFSGYDQDAWVAVQGYRAAP